MLPVRRGALCRQVLHSEEQKERRNSFRVPQRSGLRARVQSVQPHCTQPAGPASPSARCSPQSEAPLSRQPVARGPAASCASARLEGVERLAERTHDSAQRAVLAQPRTPRLAGSGRQGGRRLLNALPPSCRCSRRSSGSLLCRGSAQATILWAGGPRRRATVRHKLRDRDLWGRERAERVDAAALGVPARSRRGVYRLQEIQAEDIVMGTGRHALRLGPAQYHALHRHRRHDRLTAGRRSNSGRGEGRRPATLVRTPTACDLSPRR